jgi:hypothetical protein
MPTSARRMVGTRVDSIDDRLSGRGHRGGSGPVLGSIGTERRAWMIVPGLAVNES